MRVVLVVAVAVLASTAIADPPKRMPPRPRDPAALVLVIDRSGSMQGPKLDAAKEAAVAVVRTLRLDDRIAVVAFDTEAQVFVRPQRASNLTRIATEISRLASGGGTSVLPGLAEAHEILQDIQLQKRHVILLSDGESPSDGIADLLKAMRKDHMTVSTVAVEGADEAFLQQISTDGGGRMYKVTDLARLAAIFVEEARIALDGSSVLPTRANAGP